MAIMKIVGLREFKNRAAELIRLVESGRGEVTITRHSQPVARLVPVTKAPADSEAAALDRLAALGLIRRGNGRRLPDFEPIKVKGKPLSRIVIEDREDRF